MVGALASLGTWLHTSGEYGCLAPMELFTLVLIAVAVAPVDHQ